MLPFVKLCQPSKFVLCGFRDGKVGYLVIADISGYTQFVEIHNMRKRPIFGEAMAQKWESHAEHIITELLEAIIDTFDDTLMLNKLEGDAAFFFAGDDGTHQQADKILAKMDQAMQAFSKKATDIAFIQICPCDPCQQSQNLRLKIFAHKGSYQIKKIRQFEELAGESVILVHRLMKNSLQSREYWLITESFALAVEELAKYRFETLDETVDDFGKLALQYKTFSSDAASDPTDNLVRNAQWSPLDFIKMLRYFSARRDRTGLLESVPSQPDA